jgi:hypothetical protein
MVIFILSIFSELLTNYLEENQYQEANGHSTTEEFPCLLGNQNIQYHVHNSPPAVPVLRQMNAAYNIPPYFLKINFNDTH